MLSDWCAGSAEPREFGYHLAGTLALTFALIEILWLACVGGKYGMLP